ncbi:MAG: transposase [Fidelibacterota bacterium]
MKYHKEGHYHLYNRGVDRRDIFFDNRDYLFFLKRFKLFKTRYKVSVISYCLMPNHFHLFLKQNSEKHSIGKMIGDLTNSYTKAINVKYERIGVLFEGPTKSKSVEENSHFLWLVKYILTNPVRAGLSQKVEDWEYSSAQDLLGLRDGTLVEKGEVLSWFESPSHFSDFIRDEGLKFDYSIFF